MKKLFSIILIFLAGALTVSMLAQSRVMTVHTKDKTITEFNVTDIDSITFRTGTIITNPMPYTPAFIYTNVTEGAWATFSEHKGKVYAANLIYGINEYAGETWNDPNYIPGAAKHYAHMDVAFNGKMIIHGLNGVFVEPENNGATEYISVPAHGVDFAGTGGGATRFFLGTGTNHYFGIYWLNFEDNEIYPTNWTTGTWFSLKCLGNDVFFGAGATHAAGPDLGVVRWINASETIVATNLDNGTYNLEYYNNGIFATGHTNGGVGGTYRFNGSSFDELLSQEGVLKATGDALYFLNGSTVYKYNDTTASFDVFRTNDDNNEYTEIEAHDGFLYLFGTSYVEAYHAGSNTWINVEIANQGVSVGIAKSTGFGLFVSNRNHSYAGIRKMVPKYD